jgi:transcriptional regulator with XRE-family HTH domain
MPACRVARPLSILGPTGPGRRIEYREGVDGSNRIGEYLRARRELLSPDEVGLPNSGRRRVPGLRREELAMLAGISTDYYIRLEQGRDQRPSEQVIDGLARALQLDDEATAHLHGLARPQPRRRPPRDRAERAPTGIQQLIACWSHNPAYVISRRLDVLAANSLARALSPTFAPGVNLLRAIFLDPRRPERPDWDRVTEQTAAGLRALVSPDVEDPELNELVRELSVKSERFRSLWARHDVRSGAVGSARFDHPGVGQLELWWEKLEIPGAEQALIAFYAKPGSPSEQALALLSSIAAGESGNSHHAMRKATA